MIRSRMIDAIKAHAKGHIKKHTMNVEAFLNNPVGVGEHPDIIETIEKEIDMIAKYHDQLEVIKNYIEKDPLKPNVQ
jgi:hypothetical protein